MKHNIVERLLLMFSTLLGIAALVFLLFSVSLGDFCEVRLAGAGLNADPAEIDLCRENLGLNRLWVAQFFDFVKGYFTFDLGISLWTGQPVTYELGLRFQHSLQLAIMATVLALLIAIPLGIISAVKQNTWIDYAVRAFTVASLAIPSFWFAIMIILGLLVFSIRFQGVPWLPSTDYIFPPEDPLGSMRQLIWPAIAVGYRYAAVATRMTRSALIEALREDDGRAAYAGGLFEKISVKRRPLQKVLAPLVAIITLEFPFLIGAIVVVEFAFNLNGLGRLLVEAVFAMDFTLVLHMSMLVVLIVVICHFLADPFYLRLESRMRGREETLIRGMPERARVDQGERPGYRFVVCVWELCRRQPLGVFIVVLMVFLSVFAGVITRYDPEAASFDNILIGPSPQFWFGTDQFGRDIFTRIVYGTQTALFVGLTSAFVSGAIGILLRMSRLVLVLRRMVDALMDVPLIILSLAVVVTLGTGTENVIIAIVLALSPYAARNARSITLFSRDFPVADSTRPPNLPHSRFAWRRALPNLIKSYLIIGCALVGPAILLEASLTYLGFGMQEPSPAWGVMMQVNVIEYAEVAPWLVIFPGLAITLAVLGFNLLAGMVRRLLDPKTRAD